MVIIPSLVPCWYNILFNELIEFDLNISLRVINTTVSKAAYYELLSVNSPDESRQQG